MIAMIASCARNEMATVQGFLVFAVPSTNVCSNISYLPPIGFFSLAAISHHTPNSAQHTGPHSAQRLAYFTFAVPLRASGRSGFGAATTGVVRFRPSMKFCQKIKIGLATKTDE